MVWLEKGGVQGKYSEAQACPTCSTSLLHLESSVAKAEWEEAKVVVSGAETLLDQSKDLDCSYVCWDNTGGYIPRA